MNFVFLMDPLETVIFEKDTSFSLMLGAYRKGHRIYHLADGDIVSNRGNVSLHVTPVEPQNNKDKPFISSKPITMSAETVDAVFVRSDPPFDQQYLHNTWLLSQFPKTIPMINNPEGLRTVNEKIWVTQFKSIIPPTLIARRKQDLLEFLSAEKEVVAKPTDSHGGLSVFIVKLGDPNTNVILETLTNNWTRDIILQKYIPAAQQGDKRILLLNGEFLGAVLRIHAPDDHRNNFFAGGQPKATILEKRDLEIISMLRPELQRLGLHFVGIDIIGDYLIEVNVTSPTCLQEMNRLYNQQLENKVIDFVEKLVESAKVTTK